MGNLLSGASTEVNASTLNTVASESNTMENVNILADNDEQVVEEQFHDIISDDEETRTKNKEKEMNEFRKQLSIKREQRKEILARHRSEKKDLENALQNEKETKIQLCETNRLLRELLKKNNIEIPENIETVDEKSYISESITQMRAEIEKLKSNNNKLRCDLANSNHALQTAYTDIAELSAQNTESIKQVNALKEVITVSKTLINLREQQLTELKDKLHEIEQSLADRETNMLSADLRQEYERQLQNIRTLRGLYEERARLADVSRQALARDLEEQKLLLEAETNKTTDLSNKIEELETKITDLEETVDDKNNLISASREETRGLKAEMLVVNKLFSQVLLGYKNKQDLDKLVHRLEENHGLLTQMAGREDGSEVSTELPKLLLEIVSQIDEKDNNDLNMINEETSSNAENDSQNIVNTTPEEIVENLPKVWRVLMELLSHQSEADTNTSEKVTTCYKSVETKSGPVLVPSVSQTYIRLKDLILEKLTLIKEVNRMKQLNTHLESRLEEQERRLCLVTNELSKTWHVVGRLRRHHHQLHTHEKILKYELQQKRKLLNELKEELEYCREKWEQAREKNTQSEKDWRKLRTEFSNRKLKPEQAALNNSAESGYSDERPSDSSESNDESEYVETKVKCKKKQKKSFETILDSSTDFNLAAEREDPASDLLDVAELPLDTQEDNPECDVSDLCKSEIILKDVKVYDETEDEIADMANDSCLDDISIAENSVADKSTFDNTNVQTTNLNDLDSSFVDHLVEVPTPSDQSKDKTEMNFENAEDKVNYSESKSDSDKNIQETHRDLNLCNDTTEIPDCKAAENIPQSSTQHSAQITEIDFSAILQNVKKQNERLQIKDKRLESLENECSSIVANISNTLNSGDEMIAKLDNLHTNFNHGVPDQTQLPKQENICSNENQNPTDLEEPSSSRDIDHEARFAARDIRLKRLEEQTKSLVSKVNKTATKGVKIHYKLEELHNIYGSENSRSGTPSEDTEDISQNDDEMPNE
ncbi:reticulocyte-binding protein homolog 1-like [Vanessa cardui]|uniref:reticulocyte-binding protein homolog 1-like n=1 Tax=Vanessa cardui TaxID=171605 RepID=UPI001F1294B6|nr:reticulocyte-binding protein homolog 1-like [Vanessa cardui]